MSVFRLICCAVIVSWTLSGIQIMSGCVPHHNKTVETCPQGWCLTTNMKLPNGDYNDTKLCCNNDFGDMECKSSQLVEEMIIDSGLPVVIIISSVLTSILITYIAIKPCIAKSDAQHASNSHNYSSAVDAAPGYGGAIVITIAVAILCPLTYEVFILNNLCK